MNLKLESFFTEIRVLKSFKIDKNINCLNYSFIMISQFKN